MLSFITFIISFALIVANSVIQYGEFDLKVSSYEACKAPRRKYCAEVNTNVINDVWVKFDVLVREDMTAVKAIYMGSLNNKEIIRLRIKDICTHIFFRPLIMATFNITDRCGLFKGHHVHSVDIQTIYRSIYGGKAMYGNWSYRSLYYNDNCNLHCGNMKLMLTPKKKIAPLLYN